MLQAALRSGSAQRAPFRGLRPAAARRAAGTGRGRDRPVLDALANASVSATTTLAYPGRRRVVDPPTLEWLADYRFTGTSGDTPRATSTSRLSPHDRGGELRRGRAPRDRDPVDPEPRLGGRLGGLPDDQGRRRPAVHRDGLGRAHEQAAVAAAGPPTSPASSHLQPEAGRTLRCPHAGHGGARVRPPARLRAGRVRRPGRLARPEPRCWSTPTTSPRRCARRGDRRTGARRGPPRLRRPGRPGPRGPRATGRPGAPAPGSSSPPTWTSTPSPRSPPPPSTVTASARRWSPDRASDRGAGLQARGPRGTRRRDGSRGQAEQGQEEPGRSQVRLAPPVPAGPPRPEVIGLGIISGWRR